MGMENVIYMNGFKELTEWEHYLIEIYCANVSVAFENLYLNEELENTQKEIIYTMGEITETRSKETGHHVKRVAEYSRLLALKYGLSEQESEVIRLASPMHDVGKVGIPDAVLNKPGKLTPEEFDIMKTHASLGHEMLKHSTKKVLNAAAIIALQHHEKYDGSGYPVGLRGEEIHIYGRLSAIADVFDALCSDRVYKKAWELESVLEHLKNERGQHFDPTLVDIFLGNLDEFLKIKEQYTDHSHG
jgi:response regulator RpfG family c-di-GMP phosphodiesterase